MSALSTFESTTHKPHFYLTHGEDHPRSVLANLLRNRFGVKVDLPYYADTVTLH